MCIRLYIHEVIGSPVFYDNWVARDINGTALENASFERIFHYTESEAAFSASSAGPGPVMLEWDCSPQPSTVLFHPARPLQNGADNGPRV